MTDPIMPSIISNHSKYHDNLRDSGFFLKHPSDLFKQLKINDLIRIYCEQDPEFKAILTGQDPKNHVFIGFNDQIVTKIIHFEDNDLKKAIIVNFIRTSFHEQAKSPILYEITFSSTTRPEIKVFRLLEKELKLTYIAKMNLFKNEDQSDDYECLTATPLEIKVSLFKSKMQVVISITDHSNEQLISSVTSAHLIENPVLRLQGYLEFYSLCHKFHAIKRIIEIYLVDLIEEIEQDMSRYTEVLSELASNPLALHSILELKFWLYKNNNTLKCKNFFESLICQGFSSPLDPLAIESSENLTGSATLFTYQNQNKLLLIKWMAVLDQETIEEAMNDLQLTQEKYPNALKNVIEFYVSEEMEIPPACDKVYEMVAACKVPHLNLSDVHFFFQKDFNYLYYTFRFNLNGDIHPCQHLHHLHPAYYNLFELHRFHRFSIEQEIHFSSRNSFLFFATAKKEAGHTQKTKDERLVGFSLIQFKDLEEGFNELLQRMRVAFETFHPKKNIFFNRMIFHVNAPANLSELEFSTFVEALIEKYWLLLQGINIEKVLFRFVSRGHPFSLEVKNILYRKPEFVLGQVSEADKHDLVRMASSTELRELQVLSKGGIWAYRIPAMITSLAEDFRTKELGHTREGPRIWEKSLMNFVELDLDHSKTIIDRKTGSIDYNYGELIPVDRPIGNNEAGIILGIKTDDLGIGKPVRRLLIIGDLSHSSKGAIRAQECARVNAAIRHAARERIPIDWFAASYGVQVHREKGVEGLDAAASTIREIVRNCHHHGVQINLVIDETNIGAQSYWDSMAAILNETSGILIMTPKGCMALTGPSALVSALFGTAHSEEIPRFTKSLYPKGLQSLSGYETVHGPNSDSMLFAKNIKAACYLLLKYHYYSYIDPTERLTSLRTQVLGVDEVDEANTDAVHKEIDNFLKGLKPNREVILNYIQDKNSPEALRFWSDIKGIAGQVFKNGDLPQTPSTIVKELLIGGFSTLVIFTATGPLTPLDAEIIARAIYKANGRMQVLIIGSLSGFSCDPLSMENRQLLAGSYIAKAIVDHEGPILIVNLGNLVGGTFVVFNKQLNSDLKILAIEGSRVQVLGGKSAAKVVFHTQICKRADEDPRVLQYAQIADKSPKDDSIKKIENKNDIHAVYQTIRNQVINEIEDKEAASFDQFHNAQRAVKVGSIDQIISFDNLRGSIILAFEEMRAKYLKKVA